MVYIKSKKKEYGGILFDSIKEKNRFIELEELQNRGEISNLKIQPTFILQKSFKLENPDRKSGFQSFSAIKYTADFKYLEKGEDLYTIEEVKGSEYQAKKDTAYNIRKRLFLKKHGNEFIFYENF